MKSDGVVTLWKLRRTDIHKAALLASRAMRDNPVHVRTFGKDDAERRRRALERFFRPVLLGLYQRGSIYGASLDHALVGICGIARPDFCQPAPLEKLSVLSPVVFGNPPSVALRLQNWTAAWANRDPAEPHWHLGPVAVEPSVQRQGIGSVLMSSICNHMDAYGSIAYLETDRRENILFYQRFGFAIIAEVDVLRVPSWLMSRPGNAKGGLQAATTWQLRSQESEKGRSVIL